MQKVRTIHANLISIRLRNENVIPVPRRFTELMMEGKVRAADRLLNTGIL